MSHSDYFKSIDSLLAHAGVRSGSEELPPPPTNTPMSPPLHMATTYTRPADGVYLDSHSVYTRCDNPTRLLLEEEIAKLDCHGGGGATTTTATATTDSTAPAISCAFSSGMMAASSIILAHASPIRVLLSDDVYHGVLSVLMDVFCRFNVTVERIDMTDLEALEKALSNNGTTTKSNDLDYKSTIVWLETPSNPRCKVLDIQAISTLVHEYQNKTQNSGSTTTTDMTVVVDSTLAPPPLTRPLLLGADLVMHSCTKYFGGHSDVLLGAVTASPWTIQGQTLGPVLRHVQESVGGVASPMDCWLTLRGLRTLAVRIQRQCDNAMKLATFFEQQQENNNKIVKVHYPGLSSHPQHEIAKKQMQNGGFGGILSIEMQDTAQAMQLAAALQLVQRATSLGGTETLIEHRASIEPPGRVLSPPGLLRISVGLEDPQDIINDFERALQSI